MTHDERTRRMTRLNTGVIAGGRRAAPTTPIERATPPRKRRRVKLNKPAEPLGERLRFWRRKGKRKLVASD